MAGAHAAATCPSILFIRDGDDTTMRIVTSQYHDKNIILSPFCHDYERDKWKSHGGSGQDHEFMRVGATLRRRGKLAGDAGHKKGGHLLGGNFVVLVYGRGGAARLVCRK